MNTKRELGGLLFATKMALGGAIGFEIFQYLGLAYTALDGSSGGSAVVSALLISGILNILTMLSYCELSAILPREGGEYRYAKAAFGGFVAFTTGCVRWLGSVMGGALAALIFAEQLHRFFLPLTGISTAELILAPFRDMVLAIIATSIIAILTISSVRGTKKLGTLVLILIIIVFAIFVLKGSLHLQETSDLKSPKEVLFGIENIPSFFLATALMLQPFLGMRALVAGVSRMEKPEKNVPKAVILSTLLLMLVYGSVAYVAVSALAVNQNRDPDDKEPSLLLNLAADEVIPPVKGIRVGAILMAFVAIVACISAISTSLTVQSSILRGMSRDRYLPKILLSDHQDFETPYTAIIASSFFMIAFSFVAVILGKDVLAYAAALFSILVFALVNLSVIALRKREPYRYRPFKIPLYPIPPIAGIVVSLGLFASGFLTTRVSAVDMQTVGLLLILVLLSYYLRMVGRDRLKVAVGGISLGIGTFGILLSYLVITCNNWNVYSNISQLSAFFASVFISVISIIAGVLNISTSFQKSFPSQRFEGKRDEHLEDTIEEELKVYRISRKMGKHLSGLVLIIGGLLCVLSLWSILISDDFFNRLKVVVLGVIGVTNIISGILLLEK